MKKLMKMLAVFAIAGLAVLNACKDDNDAAPTPITLANLKAGDTDLNGATAATDVATGAAITAEFSTDVDNTTANDNTIMLIRTYDNSPVAKDISVDGKTVTITPKAPLFEGDSYKISITNGLKSTEGEAFAAQDRTFGTVGIGIGTAPQSDKQMLYIQFGGDIVDLTGNNEKSFAQVSYTADRFGNANSAASFNGGTASGGTPVKGTGDIVEISGDHLVSSSMTYSVWFYMDQADFVAPGNRGVLGLAGNNGYFLEIGDAADAESTPGWMKIGTNHKIDPDPMDHGGQGTDWSELHHNDDDVLLSDLFTTGWHQLVVSYDNSSHTKTSYLDGEVLHTQVINDGVEWEFTDWDVNTGATGVDPVLALGYYASRANTNPDWAIYSNADRTFKGSMDDFRLFNVALSASEVTTLYNAEKP